MRRIGKIVGVGLLGIVVTGMTLWGMGALYYSDLPALLRSMLAMTFSLEDMVSFGELHTTGQPLSTPVR